MRILAAAVCVAALSGCVVRSGDVRTVGPAGAYRLERAADSCVVEAATGREVQEHFDLAINGETCSAVVSAGPVGTVTEVAPSAIPFLFNILR